MKENFDSVISLGYNCQTAFALQALYGEKNIKSSFFNWVFINNISDLAHFLENPRDIQASELKFLKDVCMYNDVVRHFRYHTKQNLSHFFTKTGKLNFRFIKNDSQEVAKRMNYLKQKLLESIGSNNKNLFVLTYPDWINKKQCPSDIENLSRIIEKISKNKDTKLLIIAPKKYIKLCQSKKLRNVIYGKISHTAPIDCAHKIDLNGWSKIFKQFNIPNLSLDKTNIEQYKIKHKIKIYSFWNKCFRLLFR